MSSPLQKLKHLLESKGIYRQAVRLMREHINDDEHNAAESKGAHEAATRHYGMADLHGREGAKPNQAEQIGRAHLKAETLHKRAANLYAKAANHYATGRTEIADRKSDLAHATGDAAFRVGERLGPSYQQ